MLSVPGIFKDGKITLLQPIPNLKQARVIVTVLEEESEESEYDSQSSNGKLVEIEIGNDPKVPTASWLGSMAGTAEIVGDIVSPMEDTWQDWEVLRP